MKIINKINLEELTVDRLKELLDLHSKVFSLFLKGSKEEIKENKEILNFMLENDKNIYKSNFSEKSIFLYKLN